MHVRLLCVVCSPSDAAESAGKAAVLQMVLDITIKPLNPWPQHCRKEVDPGIDVVKEQAVSLYPVSVEWRPPFSMLVPLKVQPTSRAVENVT